MGVISAHFFLLWGILKSRYYKKHDKFFFFSFSVSFLFVNQGRLFTNK